jgi:biofilm PGA synthesis lipoprotein PgaB
LGPSPRNVVRAVVNGGLRAVSVCVLAGALAIPAYAYWSSTRPPHYGVSAQVSVRVPPAVRPARLIPRYRSGVLVLCYHDLSTRPHNQYTVTPRAFAAQMSALHGAGFHTIGAGRFTALIRGAPVSLPSRPLLITFDDGAKGTWVYADPVLRRLSYRATAFLITGDVSHHQPYYLDWPEVEEMAASGRWSFGAHTFLGHGLVAADGAGRRGPFLINRRWLPGVRRLETIGEYRSRVAADLDRSIAGIEAHGLPRPRLFAYPFSATVEPTNDRAVVPLLGQMLHARFVGLMDNTDGADLIRRGRRGPLPRVEVVHGMDAASLLERVRDAVVRNPSPPDGGGSRRQ